MRSVSLWLVLVKVFSRRALARLKSRYRLNREIIGENIGDMNYAGHIFFLICSNCVAVNIERIDVPRMVESGTESVVLDCRFNTKIPSPAGLVLKWFFNGSSNLIYQWIPPLRPQVIGLLKGKVDLNFKISDEPLQAYRAVRVVRVSPTLSGSYTCVVSTFTEEDSRTRHMTVYSSAKNFRFIQDKKYVFLVTLICFAQDLYPEPNISISSQGKALQQAALETRMNSWGLYTVAATADIHDDDVNTPYEEFVCTISLPNTNYSRNLTTVYYPGLMPTAYTAYEVQRPQHRQADNGCTGNGTPSLLLIELSVCFMLLK